MPSSSSRSSRPYRGAAGGYSRTNGIDPSQFSNRLLFVMGALCVFAIILVARLVWLQVFDAQNNLDRGIGAREVTLETQPRRGTIYDRNGTILATTVDAYNIFCHPHVVSNDKVDQLTQALVNAFGGKAEDYKNKILSDTNFVYLFKGADEESLNKIKDLQIEGVDYEKTSKRVYPCGSTASQIIGILNTDGEAITGLELYYNDILGGTKGEKTIQYSKEGVPVPGSEKVTAEVVNGKDIVLSIDVDVQQKLEEALAVRVEEVQGSGGSAMVVDSATGEIYACSSSPTFDITDLSKVEEGATNLSSISSAYEPGSTMKAATMLAALEEGKVSPDSSYYCPAALKVDEYTITDSHERGDETMSATTIIAESSNVGVSLIAKDLGFEKLYEYIQRYQLTELTGVDYPGEAQGMVAARDQWSEVQGYNISFGQGLTTTPIGMVRFYCALANNGTATQPHFLLDVPTETEDRTYATNQITDNQDAITNLESMMEATVERGTGTDAQIDGYRVVGKTGTAEIASEKGGYKSGVYNISFVGYLPDSSTNLVCFVGAYDVPGERQTVSAFRDIMAFAIDRYNITQD
ncbi:MAG: penicillin-binding protein 2 [Eggerthellaceae bacterium]